jgi:hypothetical protein
VQGGQVVLIDEHTGRTMPGRRLVRGPAPGDRGQGGRGDPEREPDPGLDHLPELLPPLRQARRHDRHGGYGGLRVPQIYGLEVVVIPTNKPMVRQDLNDLVYLTRRRSSTPSSRMSRPASSAVRRRWSVPRPWRPPRSCPRASAAKIPHKVLNAKHHEQEAEIIAQAGSSRRGDHRHQHGRPRYGHRARRQSRGGAGAGDDANDGAAGKLQDWKSATRPSSRPAACTSSAPSATNRGVSTTSCAVAPGARATRVCRASTCPSKTA